VLGLARSGAVGEDPHEPGAAAHLEDDIPLLLASEANCVGKKWLRSGSICSAEATFQGGRRPERSFDLFGPGWFESPRSPQVVFPRSPKRHLHSISIQILTIDHVLNGRALLLLPYNPDALRCLNTWAVGFAITGTSARLCRLAHALGP
jgi:hypothetical protein